MSNKPKIYGFCPAGCRHETVHYEDFVNSASLIVQPRNGYVYKIAVGNTYKIKNTKAPTVGSWGFTITVSTSWEIGEGTYATGFLTVTLPTFDKYADGVSFALLDIKGAYDGEACFFSAVYEINGERHTETFADGDFLTHTAPTADVEYSAVATCTTDEAEDLLCYRYNADAQIILETDTSDANATSEQILDGATAYVGGRKVTGNVETYTADGVSETVIVEAEVLQETGDSTEDVMSQDAVTKELAKKFDAANVSQTTGDSETAVMSQKAVTEAVDEVADCCIEKNEHISENRFNPNTAENVWWTDGAWVANTDCIISAVIPCNFGDTIYGKSLREDGVTGSLSFHVFLVGDDDIVVYQAGTVYRTYTLPDSHSSISKLAGVRIGIKRDENAFLTFDNKATIEVAINNEPTEFSAFFEDYIETVDLVEKNSDDIERLEKVKFDQANVSQEFGVDEDKVPSLALFDKVANACVENVLRTSENRFNPNTAENVWLTDGAWVANTDCIISAVIPCNFGDTIYGKFLRERDNTLGNLSFHVYLIGADNTVIYAAGSTYKEYVLPDSHASISQLLGVRIGIKRDENAFLTFDNKATIEVAINNEPTEFSAFFEDYIESVDLVEKNSDDIERLENKIRSRWYGKNLLVFGDSISTDNYPLNEYRYPKWATALKEEIGCNLYNYSVHGYGYLCGQGTVEQGQYNMINQIETAYTELSASGVIPDLIVLFMGTNDYGNTVPIGAFGDGMYTTTYLTDTYMTPKYTDSSVLNTFFGAVEHCMARIKELWNGVRIAVLVPLQREYQSTPNGTENQSLRDYCEIIISTARLFSYPVKDLYYEANFCPINKYDRMLTYQFPEDSSAACEYDGLHPNEYFCKYQLMPTIRHFVENL